MQKKNRGQYPAILTEQAWSIKDLFYDLLHQKMISDLAALESVITSGKKTFRGSSINEESTEQVRKTQNSTSSLSRLMNNFIVHLLYIFRHNFQKNHQESIQISEHLKRNSNVHFSLVETGYA